MSSTLRRRPTTSRMVAGALVAGAAIPFAAAGTASVAKPSATGTATAQGLIKTASQLQHHGRNHAA